MDLKTRIAIFAYLKNLKAPAQTHFLKHYLYKSPKSDLMLKEGTTFEQVLTLYRFDKKLRILLFNEIEKIEVAIRSVLANIGCQELNDRYWITKPEYFANAYRFNQTLAVIEKELADRCKLPSTSLQHFLSRHSSECTRDWTNVSTAGHGECA